MVKRIFDKENQIWTTNFGDFATTWYSSHHNLNQKIVLLAQFFGQKSAFGWQYNIVLQKWGHSM